MNSDDELRDELRQARATIASQARTIELLTQILAGDELDDPVQNVPQYLGTRG